MNILNYSETKVEVNKHIPTVPSSVCPPGIFNVLLLTQTLLSIQTAPGVVLSCTKAQHYCTLQLSRLARTPPWWGTPIKNRWLFNNLLVSGQ